jgi:hypothetical protein
MGRFCALVGTTLLRRQSTRSGAKPFSSLDTEYLQGIIFFLKRLVPIGTGTKFFLKPLVPISTRHKFFLKPLVPIGTRPKHFFYGLYRSGQEGNIFRTAFLMGKEPGDRTVIPHFLSNLQNGSLFAVRYLPVLASGKYLPGINRMLLNPYSFYSFIFVSK